MIIKDYKFGYLRETSEAASKAGLSGNGIKRTGLEEYLALIFPGITDWVHDKKVPGCELKIRPDYRSEQLKLIIEFDGVQHYQKPDIILKDDRNKSIYESMGYKVVRIPWFIQLTTSVIKDLFGVQIISEDLLPEDVYSFEKFATPAYMCPMGIKRCYLELSKFKHQLKANIDYLKTLPDELSGLNFLFGLM